MIIYTCWGLLYKYEVLFFMASKCVNIAFPLYFKKWWKRKNTLEIHKTNERNNQLCIFVFGIVVLDLRFLLSSENEMQPPQWISDLYVFVQANCACKSVVIWSWMPKFGPGSK